MRYEEEEWQKQRAKYDTTARNVEVSSRFRVFLKQLSDMRQWKALQPTVLKSSMSDKNESCPGNMLMVRWRDKLCKTKTNNRDTVVQHNLISSQLEIYFILFNLTRLHPHQTTDAVWGICMQDMNFVISRKGTFRAIHIPKAIGGIWQATLGKLVSTRLTSCAD